MSNLSYGIVGLLAVYGLAVTIISLLRRGRTAVVRYLRQRASRERMLLEMQRQANLEMRDEIVALRQKLASRAHQVDFDDRATKAYPRRNWPQN